MPKGRGSNRRKRNGSRRRVPRAGVAGPTADRVKLVTEAMGAYVPCARCGGVDLLTLWDEVDLVPVQTLCFDCGELVHDWSSGSLAPRGV